MLSLESPDFAEFQERLRETLEANREEVEEAIAARLRNNEVGLPLGPEYMIGLTRGAVEAVDMLVESFESGSDWNPKIPPETAIFLRYLAREEVPLDVVLRFFSRSGGVFMEFLLADLKEGDARIALRYVAAWGTRNLDRLLKAFADEYTDELGRMNGSPAHEKRMQINRVLKGGSEDPELLGYRMDAVHTGLIVIGRARLVCQRLAETLGCALLLVPDAENTWWAWFGAQREISVAEIGQALPVELGDLAIAAGEPREGRHGWRLTHEEADAAIPVAQLEGPGVVRYSDVALLATALCDVATGRSLVDRYLKPLNRHRDAADLRDTLRVYFETSCNAVSTAAKLGVNRHTVQRRLKRVEEAVGEPSGARQAEFEIALGLERLTTLSRARVEAV